MNIIIALSIDNKVLLSKEDSEGSIEDIQLSTGWTLPVIHFSHV